MKPRVFRGLERTNAFFVAMGIALSTSACNTACDKMFASKRAAQPVAVREGAALVLDTPGGDVWAWQVDLAGHAPEGTSIAHCRAKLGSSLLPTSTYAGRFSVRVPLEPGENVVSVECEGIGPVVHRSRELRLTVRVADAPVARAIANVTGDTIVLDAAASEQTSRQAVPLTRFEWFDANGALLGRERRLSLPVSEQRRRVRLVVADANGHSDECVVIVGPRGLERGATWVNDAVVYGVVPPRFGKPALRSVTASLPRLADLGVTVLWLTPITESPPDDFGYAVTDYGRVRGDFGTERDLKVLVDEAHRRGMKVILDWAANHTSARHPYYVQAERFGAESRTFGFYDRDARGEATFYFDWKHLPNLDYARPEVARFMTQVSSDWLRRFDVDGFRVDAAWGIRERTPGFYDAWLDEVRRVEPEAFVVAEASAHDGFYLEHGFDAVYDWTEKKGEWAWEHVFDDGAETPDRLERALRASEEKGTARRVLRFLNNNDTGRRFVTRHGVAKTRVATAALLSMPGIPALFTGDEVGAEYEPYGAQGTIRRDDPHGFFAFTRKLVALRRARPSLRSDRWVRLEPRTNVSGVYAAVRDDAATGEQTVVVFHFGEGEAMIDLDTGGIAKFRDLVTNAELAPARGVLRLKLPANGFALLAPG